MHIMLVTQLMSFMHITLLSLNSSNTETYAQSYCLLSVSSLGIKENDSNNLQNQAPWWSIYSWDSSKDTPGGRIKPQCWRLACHNFWDAHGQQSTRCSPSNFVCLMRSAEYSLRWPSNARELSSSRVSRSFRIWNNAYNAFYVWLLCKI